MSLLTRLRVVQYACAAAAVAGFSWLGYALTLKLRAANACYSTHPASFSPGISVHPFPAQWTVDVAAGGAIALLLILQFVLAPAVSRARAANSAETEAGS